MKFGVEFGAKFSVAAKRPRLQTLDTADQQQRTREESCVHLKLNAPNYFYARIIRQSMRHLQCDYYCNE